MMRGLSEYCWLCWVSGYRLRLLQTVTNLAYFSSWIPSALAFYIFSLAIHAYCLRNMSLNVIQYLTSTSISKSLWILKACCVRYYWHLFSRLFEPLFLVFCFCFCYIIGPKCWPAQNDWGICCFWVTEAWLWLFLYSFLQLFDCSNGHNAGINLLDFGWIKSEIAGWLWQGRNLELLVLLRSV